MPIYFSLVALYILSDNDLVRDTIELYRINGAAMKVF